jgi:hypothetical protein
MITYYRLLQLLKDTPISIKHLLQKLFRGYSDQELWSLDTTMKKFILPRLKAFKKMNRYGVPLLAKNMSIEEMHQSRSVEQLEEECETWENYLDLMIKALELDLQDIEDWSGSSKPLTMDDYKIIEKGNALFHKYFEDLWD